MHRCRLSLFKTLAVALIFTLTLSLAGCGTIIYPERRGQTGGRIDPAIAILDGVGLIVFLIPGLIAFAIDFATGAIYLPGTGHASLDGKDVTFVNLPRGELSQQGLQAFIEAETGTSFSFQHPQLQAYQFDSVQDIDASLLAKQPET